MRSKTKTVSSNDLKLWTDVYCEKMVNAGYSVIRFDHRDQGLSDGVDWEKNPYTIEDIAKDVINILNAYDINKAHVVGHSMGGMIAQWLAYTHPQRIISYTSISVATCGMIGQPPKEVMDILMQNQPTQSFENDLNGFMRSWKVLNGNYEINSQIAKKYTEDFYIRSKHPVGVAWHHIWCQQNSVDLSDKIKQITSHGLFIHGELDPLISVNGAVQTQKIVPNSRLMIITGMGHMIFNRELEDTICKALIEHFKAAEV